MFVPAMSIDIVVADIPRSHGAVQGSVGISVSGFGPGE